MHWTKASLLGLAIVGAALWITAQAQSTAAQQQAPTSTQQAPHPSFVVVLDASHGGSDSGAALGRGLMEKEVTLGLSVRLRSALQARGLQIVTTREADVAIPPLVRAETANHAEAAACLLLHATGTGSGVHLYTSSLAPSGPARPLPWHTAQAAWVTQSLKLESEINSALAHAQVPVTLGRASVQPMDNLACPAVAVEMAPLVAGHVTEGKAISDIDYQGSIINALAAAIESWRSEWKQQ